MAKQLTREQASRKKAQAAAFMERIGEPDRAEEFDSMSVEEYAEGRGARLVNPTATRSRSMARAAAGPSKADLEEVIDRAAAVLDDAYDAEASREEIASAVGKALDILNGEDEEEEEDEDDEEDGDSD